MAPRFAAAGPDGVCQRTERQQGGGDEGYRERGSGQDWGCCELRSWDYLGEQRDYELVWGEWAATDHGISSA